MLLDYSADKLLCAGIEDYADANTGFTFSGGYTNIKAATQHRIRVAGAVVINITGTVFKPNADGGMYLGDSSQGWGDVTIAASSGIIHKTSVANGKVLRANGTRFIPADLAAGDIPVHDIISKHSYTGGASLSVVGFSAANTLAVLTPSADTSGGAAALLKSNASGGLELHGLIIGGGDLEVYSS